MLYVKELSAALSDSASAKEKGRAAGEGMWTFICRALCLNATSSEPDMPSTVNVLETRFKHLMLELAEFRTLTKEDKNSLRSAKCVIKNAVSAGVEVWRKDDAGAYIKSDVDGSYVPLGKSELQNAKGDFDKLDKLLSQAKAAFSKDNRDTFTPEQLDALMESGLTLLAAMRAEKLALVKSDDPEST